MSLQRFPVLAERTHTHPGRGRFPPLSRSRSGFNHASWQARSHLQNEKEERRKRRRGARGSQEGSSPFLPFLTSRYLQTYITCGFPQTRACLCLLNASLYRLKSRTPHIWGRSNNKHLSIVLCDWPVGLPLSWRLGGGGWGQGDCGGYMLITMETVFPVESFLLPLAQ